MIIQPGSATSPTRARLIVLLWICGLTAILYLDRICMAQALVPIQKELGLSNTQISFVLMAFTLAYGIFEIPTGHWGDHIGARKVLTRIVLWWSVFTGLTGACPGFASLVVARFMFGAGEAGAFPNIARILNQWFPKEERGRVQGFILASAQIGAVLAPAATAHLIEVIGWRWAFPLFGLIGLFWAAGFWLWFRDLPGHHSGVNQEELAIIQGVGVVEPAAPPPVPWKKVFSNRGILALAAMMILGAFYTYFFYSWFPKYLQAARGADNLKAGFLASIVLGGSAFGMLAGGWLGDRITRRFHDPVTPRRHLGLGCYLAAALFFFLGTRCNDIHALTFFWALSFCSMHITLPNWWLLALPQCGKNLGALAGLLNGAGVIGALASQGFVGAFTDARAAAGYSLSEQWEPMFLVYSGVLVLGGIAWWSYRFIPIDEEQRESNEEAR
ncbi:MAG: MFS transporter [Gemmataceae bacterium]|nr:MFS transporter [Gemmataceae bacterium]